MHALITLQDLCSAFREAETMIFRVSLIITLSPFQFSLKNCQAARRMNHRSTGRSRAECRQDRRRTRYKANSTAICRNAIASVKFCLQDCQWPDRSSIRGQDMKRLLVHVMSKCKTIGVDCHSHCRSMKPAEVRRESPGWPCCLSRTAGQVKTMPRDHRSIFNFHYSSNSRLAWCDTIAYSKDWGMLLSLSSFQRYSPPRYLIRLNSSTTIVMNFPKRNYRGLWLSSMGGWLAITNTQLSDLCCHSISAFEHFNGLIADIKSDADTSSWTGQLPLSIARLSAASALHQLFLLAQRPSSRQI